MDNNILKFSKHHNSFKFLKNFLCNVLSFILTALTFVSITCLTIVSIISFSLENITLDKWIELLNVTISGFSGPAIILSIIFFVIVSEDNHFKKPLKVLSVLLAYLVKTINLFIVAAIFSIFLAIGYVPLIGMLGTITISSVMKTFMMISIMLFTLFVIMFTVVGYKDDDGNGYFDYNVIKNIPWFKFTIPYIFMNQEE